LLGIIWHNWRDVSGVPDDWTGHMGLFEASGAAKPSWFAYTRASGGQP
jgi:hypothetical protein